MVQKQNIIIILNLFCYFVYLIYIVYSTKHTFYSDDAVYASFARFFSAGNISYVIHPAWPPFYPFLSGISFQFFKNWEFSLRIVSATSVVLMLIPMYLFAKKIIGNIWGVFFILTLSLNSVLLKIAVLPQSDALALFLVISSFVCFSLVFFDFDKFNKLIYLSSFLSGLIYLTRAEGSLFFTIFFSFYFLFLVINIILKKIQPKSFYLAPVCLIIFFATISLYVIPISQRFGYLSFSHKFNAQIQQGHAFEIKNGTTWASDVTSIKNPNYSSEYFKGGQDYVLTNFNKLRIWFINKSFIWVGIYITIFPLWFFVIALVGLTKLFTKRFFWNIFFVIYVLIIAIPITIFSTAISDIRYLAWTIPILVFLYYLGWFNIIQFLSNKNYLVLIPAFLSLFFSTTLNDELLFTDRYIKEYNQINFQPEVLKVSEIIRNQRLENPMIMSRHENFEFYSGAQTIYIPQTNIENLIKYAKENKVNFLIAWYREIGKEASYSPFFEENFSHVNLSKIYRTNSLDDPLLVYRLNF